MRKLLVVISSLILMLVCMVVMLFGVASIQGTPIVAQSISNGIMALTLGVLGSASIIILDLSITNKV